MKLKTKVIEKINEKIWLFEKINKIAEHLTRIDKLKKRKDTNYQYQECNRDIDTGPEDNQSMIRGYYKPFYTHTFDNLDEMDKFLENTNEYSLPNMKQKI